MTVEAHSDRKAVNLQWDPGDYEGPVTIKTTSEADPKGSSTKLEANEGHGAVTFPLNYSGSFNVKVLDDQGANIDEGDVEVA